MDLKLNQEQLTAIISGAILAQITDDMRADIIRQAIIHLTTTRKDTYGRGQETPLQSAFNSAVDRVAYEVAHDYVATSPEFRDAIKEAMKDAAAAAIANSGRLRERLMQAAVEALGDTWG